MGVFCFRCSGCYRHYQTVEQAEICCADKSYIDKFRERGRNQELKCRFCNNIMGKAVVEA